MAQLEVSHHGPLGVIHYRSVPLAALYLAVSAVYGTLAYLTGSILPGVALHMGGNILGGILLLMSGYSWWQTSSVREPLIWESGTDVSFWASCFWAVFLGLAAVWTYRGLAREARASRGFAKTTGA